ncbi:agmatine deiminase family protein [Pelotomaculum isophthalicicum JI]|uniref:Agmatine deiminase family protein n=1 Tax=Pelotomaculum isophthalicicum JI TaxID=947010 RepID=A0A9X4JU36_9FIRM|nr:agmatine deiminase family protein [Pelotomaculum isophthalicicum]MDF9408425.1 agmatine deiminase family protein [Pelotomaculum isophthalicicum JI]
MKKEYSIIILVFACMLIILSIRAFTGNKAYQKPAIDNGSDPITYVSPGEFEKQQAIWLLWPEGMYSTASKSIYPVYIDIIKALEPHVRVNLISQSKEEAAQIEDLLNANGYSGNNINFYIIDHLSIWARDVGPVFVKDSQNRLNVVNFGFDNYGRGASQDYIDVESQIDKKAAQMLNLPVISTNLVSEGGGVESNGRGIIMLTESVALNRNPEMTKSQIENEYKRVLGAKKVIWLKQGLAEDDLITVGHINEIARFASPDTILLAQVLPEDKDTNLDSQKSYLRLEENYNILLNSTDQDGKPFHIIRIPMPPTLYGEIDETGKIPVRSYLNYAVTNGVVLMQTYWVPGRSDKLKTTEDQVKGIFQSVFPVRTIIGINDESVNFWGGGIHCITQHMPAN